MVEEKYIGVYRGCELYYYPATEKYGSPCIPGFFSDLATVKSKIDDLRDVEEIEPVPEEQEVLIEVYKDCAIYFYTISKKYATPCIPGLLSNIYKIRDEIDKLREEPEPPPPEPPPPEDEDEEPPPEPAPPPTLDLPALPWYASWLQPILEYIGELTESVVNFFDPIFAPIKNIASNILELPADAINALKEAAGDILERQRNRGTAIAVSTVEDILAGTPEWMKALQEGIEGLEAGILAQYTKAVDVATYEKSPLTGEQAVEALQELKGTLVTAALVNFTVHALIEAGSLGQFEFMKELDTMVASKYGWETIVNRATLLPIEKAILVPAEYEYNTQHPNMIPTYTDLINMVVKEVIDLDRFKAEMLKLGFRDEWSQFIWDAHFRPPAWEQLVMAYHRGAITEEELMTMKILVDLDPRYDVVWNNLIEQIPPYSELVNELVKEVIDKDEFTKYMRWYGFDEKWAARIWDAHFLPPALGDIITAWRRDLITEERVDELMILVDLDPRFKEIFDTRKYIDPSVTVGRFMFETGAIDEERLRQIVARQGYLPEDIDPITEFLVRFQERRFRTYYLRALATGAVYGAYTPEEVLEEVTGAGYQKEVGEWMLKTAEARLKTTEARRKAPKPKLLGLGDLKKSYARDIIDEDVFRTELLVRDYETGDVDLLVSLMNSDKVTTEAGGRKIALSQTELLNAWRYAEVTEDYVNTELQLRGLTTDEVNILLNTKRKQWGLVT